MVFLVAGFTAFTTGTSWGTYGILVPLVMPLGAGNGPLQACLLGAMISGGVFGDHSSPISDTTVVSSMASGCPHIEHVRTQVPYALAAGGLAVLIYLLAGFFL